MNKPSKQVTRRLTQKYVFALGLLAALAVLNFVILRTAIHENRAMALIASHSGRQRMLLYRTAMLAERLVFESSRSETNRLRAELKPTIGMLEKTHFDLMPTGAAPRATKSADQTAGPSTASLDSAAARQVQAIYEDTPWVLDSEIRNYLLHLRLMVKSPDSELTYDNPHFKYVRDSETIDKILGGLEAVLKIYEQRSTAKTAQLQRLATWSLVSTLLVLALDGLFVFHPMVNRVRKDMRKLNDLNATLEERVAERTAEAERRAEQLAVSESKLRDSAALYRSLVDHLPMYVLRKDRQGRLQFANSRFCELVGRSLQDVIGCTDAELYPPAMAAKYRDHDQRVMERQTVYQGVEEHPQPGGKQMYVEVLKAPLRDAEGAVIGTQTAFWDVTDRIHAEERVLHAQRLAAIGQMVAGVAHESRNALQQIQACSQLLSWELDGDEAKQELIADLQKAQDRLLRLFEELRGYAAPRKPDTRPCDVREIVQQVWDELAPQRTGRDTFLREIGDPSPVEIQADPFQLGQVFRNLLENSLAACEDPAIIEVEYRRSEHLETVVRDNGPGLSPEQQEKIFEPFFTTKTRGSGLGMAIVKQIVEAHGGVIQAGNHVGGAEIIVMLPVSTGGTTGRSTSETTAEMTTGTTSVAAADDRESKDQQPMGRIGIGTGENHG